MEKACSRCHVIKPLTQFNKSFNGKFGHKAACRECTKFESKRYNVENKEVLSKKNVAKHLKRTYGLTESSLSQMKIAQNDKCLICLLKKPLVVDHCHNTGKIRGLLCRTCNTGIGQLNDDPEIIGRASLYVSIHRA